MLTKAKKSLLVSLSALLCVMLLAFGLSTTSIFAHKTANAADESTTVENAVAKIGDVTYATLDEAIAAANESDVVYVLNDCELNADVSKANIIIEGVETNNSKPVVTGCVWFKGESIQVKNLDLVWKDNHILSINGNNSVFENCVIRGTTKKTGYLSRISGNNIRLINCVFNGFVDEENVQPWLLGVNAENAVMTECTFKNAYMAIYTAGGAKGDISLNDCKFENAEWNIGGANTSNNIIRIVANNCNFTGLMSFNSYCESASFVGCTLGGNETRYILSYNGMSFERCTFEESYLGGLYISTENDVPDTVVAVNNCKIVDDSGNDSQNSVLSLASTNMTDNTSANPTGVLAVDAVKNSDGGYIGGSFAGVFENIDANLADGYISTKNENGTYSVKEGVYVAQIGNVKYETLTAAIAAAKDGDTVKLLADVEQNSEVAIKKSITLDLNGKKIYNTVDIWDAKANPVIVSLIDIENGADVTITGNGTIAAKEDDCYTINITEGNLTIENGTFVGNISVVQVQKGTLTINGGTFSLLQKMTDGKGADRYLINCIDDAFADGDAKVAISGGSFAGFDPNVSPEKKVDGKVPSFAAEGVGITKNEDGSFTATTNMAAQILDSNGNSVAAYDTLAEAFDNVNTGDTVTLLKDITLTEQINIVKALDGLTLDGNGHTIICKTTEDVFASGGSALYFGNANDKKYCTGIKIKDLTMSGKARFAIFLCGGTTTEFTNVNISGEYYIGVNLYGTHGATMTNCNISNSTEGTDEYISAVWSNVASANPLKLVNSTVSTIAINAYTSANKLEPKISIDKDSRAEVHTFDDGSVSGNKKLCVSTESEGTYTIKEFNETDKSWVDVVNPVAQIDSTYYQTLAEAIAAAKDGDTVKLLADCNGNGIQIDVGKFETKGLIVDFGGYTYTVGGVLVGSSGTGTNAFQLLKDNNITFKNGSIVGVTEGTKPAEDTPNWHGAPAMMIQNYANLTLYNMTISGGTETVYTMSNNNGNVVIENSTINAGSAKGCSYGPFAFDVCRFSSYPSVTVTVKGNSIINGDIEISGAIGAGQSRQLNIEGGEFSGTFKVSDVPANISISGGTFSNEIPADYCADGFRVAKNGDSYGVVEKYILTSQVTLGTDISFKYKVERTDLDKVELSYYKVGATEPTVYELTKDGDCYVFSGITPQMIDRKISVTVYAGDYVVYDVVEYSVLDYLQEVLDLYGDTTKNLVASLAYYGKAAMNHVGYETDTVETFITANNLAETTGEISGGTMVSGGTEKVAKLVVRFESQNKMLVKVSKDVFANYTYKITVNGKEIENVEWKTDIIDGYYVYATDGIAARYITDKDHSVAVKVYKDGEEVQSFQYNIAGYCVKLQDSEKFGEMAKATYNYGVAAAAYAAAQTNA